MKKMLLLVMLLSSVCRADSTYDAAIQKAQEAFYIQSGLDKYMRILDEKYTPEFMKNYGGWPTIIYKTIQTQQINYTIYFP